jgi:lysozyme family protein
MIANWDFAFTKMIGHEGGFTDDVRDPGNKLPDGRPGSTNLGVTQKAWEAYLGRQVTHEEMKALTPVLVKPFYKHRYWDMIRGDDLPHGVDYVAFDTCVNSGPKRAAIILQEAVNANPDGSIGPMTLRAVQSQPSDVLVKDYCARRLAFMKSLPTWETYGKGWERRVKEVEAMALKLIPEAQDA